MDALGDGTRMAIFQKLARGPMAVHELAAVVPVSRPAVSQHLRVLKDAGLIRDSKEGTRRMYQLDPAGIARLRAHFDQVWTGRWAGSKARRRRQHLAVLRWTRRRATNRHQDRRER